MSYVQSTNSFTVNGTRFTLAGVRVYYTDGSIEQSPRNANLPRIIKWAKDLTKTTEIQCINIYAEQTYPCYVGGILETRNYKICIRASDYYWITGSGDFGGGAFTDVPADAARVLVGSLMEWDAYKAIVNRAMNDEVW